MRNLFLLSCALLLLGCDVQSPDTVVAAAEEIDNPDPQTIFQQYLRTGFQQTIPEAEHWFVVIPSFGCKGCNIEELRVLSQGPKRSQVTVVAAHLLRELAAPERRRLAQVTRLLADTTLGPPTQLDQLQLPFPAYTGIIQTRNGKIQKCIPFDKAGYPAAFTKLPADATVIRKPVYGSTQ